MLPNFHILKIGPHLPKLLSNMKGYTFLRHCVTITDKPIALLRSLETVVCIRLYITIIIRLFIRALDSDHQSLYRVVRKLRHSILRFIHALDTDHQSLYRVVRKLRHSILRFIHALDSDHYTLPKTFRNYTCVEHVQT